MSKYTLPYFSGTIKACFFALCITSSLGSSLNKTHTLATINIWNVLDGMILRAQGPPYSIFQSTQGSQPTQGTGVYRIIYHKAHTPFTVKRRHVSPVPTAKLPRTSSLSSYITSPTASLVRQHTTTRRTQHKKNTLLFYTGKTPQLSV